MLEPRPDVSHAEDDVVTRSFSRKRQGLAVKKPEQADRSRQTGRYVNHRHAVDRGASVIDTVLALLVSVFSLAR